MMFDPLTFRMKANILTLNHPTCCDNMLHYILFVTTLLRDVAKFTLYFTRILSELGQIHYMKSW
jgi:hypothetical protein